MGISAPGVRIDTPAVRVGAPGIGTGLACLAAALLLSACTGGGGPGGAPGPAPSDGGGTPAAESRPDLEELETLYRARMDSARMDVSQADVDFMTGMIGHHAQALIMSRLAPTHGASSRIQTLAGRIINAQKDEISVMQAWLRDRGQVVPEVEIDGLELTVHGAQHAHHMPGMLTPEQLRELDAARGAEFDRLFLTYMIQHHQGAVSMVIDLFAIDGAAMDDLSFKLANDIQVDQITEIRRMELMLDELNP